MNDETNVRTIMPMSKPFALCLIVDDDADVLLSAKLVMKEIFDEVITASSPQDGMALFERRHPDLVLLDANFARGATDGSEGFQWMRDVLKRDPTAAIVLITAHGGVRIAVEAMKRGAIDFVSKPWNYDRLLATARTAASLRQSRGEEMPPARKTLGSTSLLGESPAIARVLSLIEKAAPTEANILILGENGTGKELVAQELHRRSRRSAVPMLSVDLGAISESLFDSELFGATKGAFTDAKTDRVGRLVAAGGGTLFLDEVGNLPLHLQPKLLTALEQRRVTPVGATKPTDIDVRVIAATNMRPDQLRDERHFRQDLLFRLNTVEIRLPSLRERTEDIPVLLEHFLRMYSEKYDRPQKQMSSGTLEKLASYDWPGNVRALRHAAERAVILSTSDALTIDDFPVEPHGTSENRSERPPAVAAPDDLNLDRAESRLVERALKKNGYNISHAAAELGLTRAALYRRMEKHGL